MYRDTFHYPRLLSAPSNGALDIVRKKPAIASLGTLRQGPSTLTGKNFFPISNLNLFTVQLLNPECPARAADVQFNPNPEVWLDTLLAPAGFGIYRRAGRSLARFGAAEGRALARAVHGRYRPRPTVPPGGDGIRRPPLTPPFDIVRSRSGRTPGAAGVPGMKLRTSLEEHQSALELIMSKYREQMFRLLMASKKDDPSIIMKLKEQHSKELQVHVDQITEMAAVMRKAIEVDERHSCKEQERITQLEQENKGLREILQITRESFLNLKKDDASESTSLSGLVTSSDLSLRKS
ncbi:FGFR1 oncogene partner 2 isoform X2 [Passer domesticus]|uniref:FGFR1 oncogene partner 2 isoform X2 n=1 Tax=Passer domesticus TaxID=48849 RepID=UPI0030FE617E